MSSTRRWRTSKVRRALRNTLRGEPDRENKLATIRSLKVHPEHWQLPALTRVLEQDPDTPTRVMAGRTMQRLMRGDWNRLETREVALDAARRSVPDEETPIEIRRTSADILKARASFVDLPLREALAHDPAFKE